MFPDKINEREFYILSQVKTGNYEFSVSKIKSSYKNDTAEFFVMSTPLRVDDVFVNVSAFTQQKIADFLGLTFLTEKLACLMYKQANLKLEPCIRQITSSTSAMIDHSKKIDAQIKDSKGLIVNGGKNWLIGNKATTKKAINFGWFTETKSNTWKGIKVYPPPSDLSLKVIQPSSTTHDFNHVDYSQTCTLALKYCIVNGQEANIEDLLKDPDLSHLASHEGKLNNTRQPGVPQDDYGTFIYV